MTCTVIFIPTNLRAHVKLPIHNKNVSLKTLMSTVCWDNPCPIFPRGCSQCPWDPERALSHIEEYNLITKAN